MSPEIEHIVTAAAFMAGLGTLLASVLVVANRKLFVYEDPRIDEVEQLLPSANCGACGTPGCRPFAEMLVNGEITPAACTVNSEDDNLVIADYLGVDAGDVEKRVARLACAGGSHVAFTRAGYEGLKSCRAASVVAGGGKGCAWGCIGLSDCEIVCDFDAIAMNKFGLPMVNEDKCTACGDCVDVCPKDLFSLEPVSHQLWVACKNLDPQDEAESHCDVVCTACARCAADAPEGVVTIANNLAIVDYEKNALASKLAIERCPTGAIVWLDNHYGMVKGVEARKVLRQEPLPRV
ncbi:Fe-S cluster protein [Solemya pervernicosa gill symbiont]|uniref:Ion-translocating oxidoreductase complex subunit B n=1 Tax=Solemya pervernicosa gill symbiont TaxID=642797 RepID=A0A1T2L277_9GAMM|nr:RnfABCDGE type electron transport complex subunit B [Solemya pervernicosa gill symbiont]OOZ39130.1 Fe-S cluster protein [Solemya pervernicosa gill symbiont]